MPCHQDSESYDYDEDYSESYYEYDASEDYDYDGEADRNKDQDQRKKTAEASTHRIGKRNESAPGRAPKSTALAGTARMFPPHQHAAHRTPIHSLSDVRMAAFARAAASAAKQGGSSNDDAAGMAASTVPRAHAPSRAHTPP